jgi:ubiquitin C-terminal hydrolase
MADLMPEKLKELINPSVGTVIVLNSEPFEMELNEIKHRENDEYIVYSYKDEYKYDIGCSMQKYYVKDGLNFKESKAAMLENLKKIYFGLQIKDAHNKLTKPTYIINKANVCYLNSLIQILFLSVDFVIKICDETKQLNKYIGKADYKSYKILVKLFNHNFNQMLYGNKYINEDAVCILLDEKIFEKPKHPLGGRQQDAEELFAKFESLADKLNSNIFSPFYSILKTNNAFKKNNAIFKFIENNKNNKKTAICNLPYKDEIIDIKQTTYELLTTGFINIELFVPTVNILYQAINSNNDDLIKDILIKFDAYYEIENRANNNNNNKLPIKSTGKNTLYNEFTQMLNDFNANKLDMDTFFKVHQHKKLISGYNIISEILDMIDQQPNNQIKNKIIISIINYWKYHMHKYTRNKDTYNEYAHENNDYIKILQITQITNEPMYLIIKIGSIILNTGIAKKQELSLSDESIVATKTYNLCGFNVHRGIIGEGGHYVSYVKYNNQWFFVDDKNPKNDIEQINFNDPKYDHDKQQAYIICYKKID